MRLFGTAITHVLAHSVAHSLSVVFVETAVLRPPLAILGAIFLCRLNRDELMIALYTAADSENIVLHFTCPLGGQPATLTQTTENKRSDAGLTAGRISP